MDQEVNPRGPELVVPTSMGELCPELLAIHAAQQANLSMQLARQQRNQARHARRGMNRAGTPAVLPAAGQPAMSLSAMVALGSMHVGPLGAPAFPPRRCEMGDATLERQARVRPPVTPPIISDGDFT
eukprot:4926624-Pyramimonas_sp.AAC.1